MALLSPVHFLTAQVNDDPVATLWHYVCGHMLDWRDGVGGALCWRRVGHRGVQFLDKVEFPRRQKRYIFSPLFEIKFDHAFEETIRGCAGQPRGEQTWISEEYVRAMVALHRMGFAHSFEAWRDGRLVGGAFGVQLGSMMTCDSMFHRESNASKAAYGQTLVRLQQRGFKLVDTNGVAAHQVKYGEEWVPQWRFERLIYDCLRDAPTLVEGGPPPPALPKQIRVMLPLLRVRRAVARRMPGRSKEAAPPAVEATGTAVVEPEVSAPVEELKNPGRR